MRTEPGVSASTSNAPVFLLDFEKPLAKMEREIQQLEASQAQTGRNYSEVIASIRTELENALRTTYGNLTPWETVMVARHPKRPLLRDYIRMIAKDFCELHGDRLSGDDAAIITGFARMAGHKVMLIGHQKGRDTKEKIKSNFGCAHPEGYRKALQKMKLAAKFGVPVVCLIDTPGAYPGVESEERGIAQAIAQNLMEMSILPTPVVAAVIGEGGSGGALGIGVADQVAVMQHAYYSVISPEGCAAILWKSGEQVRQAADALKFTAHDLLKIKLIDAVIPEPLGGAHRDPQATAANLETWIGRALRDQRRLKIDTVLKRRYERLRNLGSEFARSSGNGQIVSVASAPATVVKPRGKRSAGRELEPAGERG
jgi:acetyl-CoA carboxylase carboxyl transferase subunit alpha